MIVANAVDLSLTSYRHSKRAHAVDLSLTNYHEKDIARQVDLLFTQRADVPKLGYIAGTQDGIVTAGNKPASRQIFVMDANNNPPQFHLCVWSLPNGHYLIPELDPEKEYLVMVRDSERQFEPFAYDYVKPAHDLTFTEQQELWQSWLSQEVD